MQKFTIQDVSQLPHIHPTAIVDAQATIDPTAEIGPYAIIEGPVQIGARTKVMAHAHILGKTVIGEDNEIHMGCVVGQKPQHLAYKECDSGVRIGNGNVLREYVTIHRAYHGGHNTVLGDNNFLMTMAHVGHDSVIGNRVIITNTCLIAGHVHIDDGAVLSGYVGVHQYVRVGRLVMIGGMSKVVKDVPPFMLLDGNSLIRGVNSVGLRRNGFTVQDRVAIKNAYRILYRSGLNVPQAVETMHAEMGDHEAVQQIVAFIKGSVRGICRHAQIGGREEPEE